MTVRKRKDIHEILSAHAVYLQAFKQHRRLDRAVADHIAAALPKGTAIEWPQGEAYNDCATRFELGTVTLFPTRQQVWTDDGNVALGCKEDEPGTEWRDVKNVDNTSGYPLCDGADSYNNEVPGVSRTQLRAFVKFWKTIPYDVFDRAYGNNVVRIYSNGALTVTRV